MTNDTNLACKDDVVADCAGAGEADLGAEQGVFANNGAVADLNQVVDLGPGTNAGLPNGSAIDAGIGLHFHIVLKHGWAGLGDLVPGEAFVFQVKMASKAKAVGTNDGAVLEEYVVAEVAVLTNDCVGVSEEAVADDHVWIENDMGKDDGIVADGDFIGDDGVGADVGTGADPGAG